MVVTASHNPKEYSGYKIYDEFGCQLIPWQPKIENFVRSINPIKDINVFFEIKKIAGKVPEAYKDVISGIKVEAVRRKVKDAPEEPDSKNAVYGTSEEMLERAKE